MRVNAFKMQILMGKKNLTIKELAYKSAVSRQTYPASKQEKAVLHRWRISCHRRLISICRNYWSRKL